MLIQKIQTQIDTINDILRKNKIQRQKMYVKFIYNKPYLYTYTHYIDKTESGYSRYDWKSNGRLTYEQYKALIESRIPYYLRDELETVKGNLEAFLKAIETGKLENIPSKVLEINQNEFEKVIEKYQKHEENRRKVVEFFIEEQQKKTDKEKEVLKKLKTL